MPAFLQKRPPRWAQNETIDDRIARTASRTAAGPPGRGCSRRRSTAWPSSAGRPAPSPSSPSTPGSPAARPSTTSRPARTCSPRRSSTCSMPGWRIQGRAAVLKSASETGRRPEPRAHRNGGRAAGRVLHDQSVQGRTAGLDPRRRRPRHARTHRAARGTLRPGIPPPGRREPGRRRLRSRSRTTWSRPPSTWPAVSAWPMSSPTTRYAANRSCTSGRPPCTWAYTPRVEGRLITARLRTSTVDPAAPRAGDPRRCRTVGRGSRRRRRRRPSRVCRAARACPRSRCPTPFPMP